MDFFGVATGAPTGAAGTVDAAGAFVVGVWIARLPFATATVPAIVKNDATLNPPKSQRVAAAG